MACFAENNVSQGSVAAYARSGGIVNTNFATNLPRNLPEIFLNRLRFDRIMVVSLWPHFLAQPCTSAVKWRVSAMYDGAVSIHYLVKHYSQQNKPLGKLYC